MNTCQYSLKLRSRTTYSVDARRLVTGRSEPVRRTPLWVRGLRCWLEKVLDMHSLALPRVYIHSATVANEAIRGFHADGWTPPITGLAIDLALAEPHPAEDCCSFDCRTHRVQMALVTTRGRAFRASRSTSRAAETGTDKLIVRD